MKHYLLMLMSLVIFGCLHSEPNVIYMPDMVYGPAFKAQSGHMRTPPVGSIPRTFEPYPFADDIDKATEIKNPLRATRKVLDRGKKIYNTYCIVCHGPYGEGNGSIIGKFPMPPSLQSDKIRSYKDGNIYHVISVGQNLMPSYASQIESGDRWAIIHYIRVLQRARHPTDEDLKQFEQE